MNFFSYLTNDTNPLGSYQKTLLDDLRTTVGEFFDDLEEFIFVKPEEKGDMILVKFFFEKMDNQTLMNHVVEHVLPHKKKISKRETKFFIKQKTKIFAGLPPDRVDYFADLIQSDEKNGGLSEENKKIVWSYWDTMVELATKYKKEI